MFLTSKTFWADTVERAVKTFAQAAVALLGGQGLGLLDVNWPHIASVAALAAVVSVLTSVGSAGKTGSASLVTATPKKTMVPV